MNGYLQIELPTSPSAGLREIVERSETAKNEALVYEIDYARNPIMGIREKSVKITCTACRGSYWEPYISGPQCGRYALGYGFFNSDSNEIIKEREKTRCGLCGAKGLTIRKSSIRTKTRIAEDWASELRKVEGCACFLGFLVLVTVTREAEKKIEFQPWEAAVLSGGKVFRAAAHQKNIGGEIFYRAFEGRKRFSDEWGRSSVEYVPEGAFRGTEAENSRWDVYCKSGNCYPVSYIKQWTHTPVIEAIVETGGASLITDAIEGKKTQDGYYARSIINQSPIPGISRKERRPSSALGLTREEYRTAIRKRWPMALVRLVARAKKDGMRISEADADAIMTLGDRFTNEMYDATGQEFLRTLRYLIKQRKKTRQKDLIGWRYYRDYLNMAQKNGEDLAAVRYPGNLKAAHDRQVVVTEERKTEEHRAEFEARAAKLLALSWEADGLLIRPAMSEAELRAEGKNLSHCVAGYAGRVRRGETAILFIRQAAEPDASFFTLEMDERKKKVIQNRGDHNCARTPEVEAFEEIWLEHIRRDLTRDKDGNWKERKKHERTDDESAA